MPDPDEVAAMLAAELAALRAEFPAWVIEEDGGSAAAGMGLAAWPRLDPARRALHAAGTEDMRSALAAALAPAPPAAAPVGTVYLLHFSRPLGHARHYTGWSGCLEWRVSLHQAGRSGVPLVRAAVAAGITLELARTWPGETRAKERRLKTSGGAARYCPLCRAARVAPAAGRAA